MRKIKSIKFLNGNGKSWAIVNEPLYNNGSIGKLVTAIEEHEPDENDNRYYYDICFKDGEIKRVFNVDTIDYEKDVA